MSLQLSQDAAADALLSRSPLALLIGMVLDQQIPLEHAFAGPLTLRQRLGRELDAGDLAGLDPELLATIFSTRPALHRFPKSMAARVQALCAHLVERYGGDAGAVWQGASDGFELRARLAALPGFGPQKAQIFLALLGKQLGVRPSRWREAAGAYGEEGSHRSVADITDAGSRQAVRDFKRAAKATHG